MYLLFLILAAAAFVAQCEESCRPSAALELDTADSPALALLQAGVSQARKGARDARELPRLRPVGRSYYSQDPKRSAEWFMRYFGGSAEEGEFAAHAQNAEIALVGRDADIGPIRIMFVKEPDEAVNEGLDLFVDAVEEEWQKVMDREFIYSPWIDFHDGLSWSILNVSNARKDNLAFQSYNAVVNRFIVPNTSWTFELVATTHDLIPPVKSLADLAYWKTNGYPDPDLCRNHTNLQDFPTSARLWWKSTYAVQNAGAAADFAMQALGAEASFCPYKYPADEGCTAAKWLTLPGPNGEEDFAMHFVESFEYPSGEHSIQDLHEYVEEQVVKLSTGCLPLPLYNNIVFEAETLDPFIERLDALKTTYLAMEQSEGRFSLVFAFPGNAAVVVQISSSKLTKVTPKPVKTCDV